MNPFRNFDPHLIGTTIPNGFVQASLANGGKASWTLR